MKAKMLDLLETYAVKMKTAVRDDDWDKAAEAAGWMRLICETLAAEKKIDEAQKENTTNGLNPQS